MKLGGAAPALEQYMDLLGARQKLVSSNVANAATPGYKTKDIDFQYEFVTAMAARGSGAAGPEASPVPPPEVVEVPGLKGHNDGNNVGLDRELRLLSENSMRFNAASSLWKQQARMIRAAIEEGRNG